MYPPEHRYTARVYRAKTINRATLLLVVAVAGMVAGYLASLAWSA